MERVFKSAKLSFKMTSEKNPDGTWRSYNYGIENVTDEQLTGCVKVLTDLSNEEYFMGRIVDTTEVLQ